MRYFCKMTLDEIKKECEGMQAELETLMPDDNHTLLNPRTGLPEKFYDICDELAGDYPKSFLWTGWHPQCRCVITPILIGLEDFKKMLAAEIM